MKKKKLSTIDITPFNQTKGMAVKDMQLSKNNIVCKLLCSKKTEYLNKVLGI